MLNQISAAIISGIIFAVLFLLIMVIILLAGLKIVTEYERLIVFRFGRYKRTIGPGIVYILPLLERAERVDLRIKTADIAKQDIITRDNIPLTVDTSVFYRVVNPQFAKTKIVNFMKAPCT
jgi:regulator of protease activity HflC (stomatin/prohibitin superfamily)